MNKKLILACYFFPPCPSIGGRRSAKFAKYLARAGDLVHVIQAKNCFPTISPWLKDVEGKEGIIRHELPLNYPIEFIIPPHKLIGKIMYRLLNLYFSLFHSRKNRFDYTLFWKKEYQTLVRKLIEEHNIKNVFVSGPPFYYAYQTVKLKEQYPDLNIIIDFRDPWIDSPYYGMNSLSSKQLDYEISMLNKVYKAADFFIGPNGFLLERQKRYIYPSNHLGAKFMDIPHGYDPDEFPALVPFTKKESGPKKVRIVYGGQLYPGIQDVLIALNRFLNVLKVENPEIYENLEIDFYVPEVNNAVRFTENERVVKFHNPIGNNIMARIREATFCFILLAEHNKDFRTTKFLEYAILGTPFIVLGKKGHVAEFVEKNNLGKAYDETTIHDLKELLKNAQHLKTGFSNGQYDFSEYSYEKITEKLRQLLK